MDAGRWLPIPRRGFSVSVGVGFIQVQNLTGGDVFEHLLLAQWPLDLQALDDGLLAQPYVEPHVAGAQVAAGRIDLAILRDSAGGDAHLGAEAETVALPAPRLDGRSEERRVGKECRSRWAPYHLKKL